MRSLPLALIALLLASLLAFRANPAGKFALTIDNIMRGPELYGYEPSAVRWSGDGGEAGRGMRAYAPCGGGEKETGNSSDDAS